MSTIPNVWRLNPMVGNGVYGSTVVWLPFDDGERTGTYREELDCVSQGVIGRFAVEPDGCIVDVKLTDWEAPEYVGDIGAVTV